MNYIKLLKKYFGIYLLLSLLILSSCTFYKTLEIAPVTDEALNATFEFRKFVVIHNDDMSKEYFVSNMVIEKDSISGLVTTPPQGKIHEPMSKSFIESKTVYPALSTLHIYSSVKEINLGAFSLNLEDIRKVEIHEKAKGKSIWTSLGMTTLGVVTLIALLNKDKDNGGGFGNIPTISPTLFGGCPQVTTSNANGSQFHGALFPGSIFESLKRDDYLMLENYVSDHGDLKLSVFNDFPEVEYIDQLGLLEIDHKGFDNLGVNNENKFVAYNKSDTSVAVLVDKEELSNILSLEDGVVYDFDDADAKDQLNAITLKFDRTDFSKKSYLVIRGKYSQWIETVAEFTLTNIGNSFDDWVDQKDEASGNKWRQKNIRQGVSLNVYLKKNNEWEYVGSHHDAGTLAMKNLLMTLDLENDGSPHIEIKLESAYKIWEIDYVGLTDDWTDDLSIKQLDFASARDQNDQDVSMKIKSTDDIYQVQDNSGTFIELQAEGISDQPNTSLVLHGSGYYDHLREYEHKANPKFVTHINSTLGIQDVSRELYFYKTIMPFVFID